MLPTDQATRTSKSASAASRRPRGLREVLAPRLNLTAEEIIRLWGFAGGDHERFRELFNFMSQLPPGSAGPVITQGWSPPTFRTDTAFKR